MSDIRRRIGKRISDAIDHLAMGHKVEAMEQALLAVATTSTKTYRNLKKDNERFKEFVGRNLDVITRLLNNAIRINGDSLILRVPCDHPELAKKKLSPDGCYPIQDIIYQIRCDLIHESESPSNIQLTDDLTLGGNPFLVPKSLIYGLLFAVVVAPINQLEYIPPQYTITIGNKTAQIKTFWGEKKKFIEWFDIAESNGVQFS